MKKELIKTWVKTWKRAETALRNIKRTELENYDYVKNINVLNQMLEYSCKYKKIRKWSGLVEQQRVFARL